MTIPKGAKMKGIPMDRITEKFLNYGYTVKGGSEGAVLKDGDVVKCVIDGIGELINTVGKAGQNEIR